MRSVFVVFILLASAPLVTAQTAAELRAHMKDFLPEELWQENVAHIQRLLDAGRRIPPHLLRIWEAERPIREAEARFQAELDQFNAERKHTVSTRTVEPTLQHTAEVPVLQSNTIHEIAFASSGHTLEIDVSNTLNRDLRDIRVTPRAVPAWLALHASKTHIPHLGKGETASVLFSFTVGVDAPIGETTTLVFDIATASGPLLIKEIALQVSAPERFRLFPNYPNPFNPRTTIAFQLPQASRVLLRIYDALGREIAVLVEGERSAGHHEAVWEASRFASGMYFYRLVVEDATGTRTVKQDKMLLLK